MTPSLDSLLVELAKSVSGHPLFATYTNSEGDEAVITVVPLPYVGADKGRAALVVYGNGQTERYEQITRLSNGAAVALRKGRIIELTP